MDSLLAILGQIPLILGQAAVAISALIALFMLIPGEEPEKSLQKLLDVIKKFSKKPKE